MNIVFSANLIHLFKNTKHRKHIFSSNKWNFLCFWGENTEGDKAKAAFRGVENDFWRFLLRGIKPLRHTPL